MPESVCGNNIFSERKQHQWGLSVAASVASAPLLYIERKSSMFRIPSVKLGKKGNDWENCKVTQLPLDIFIQVKGHAELVKEEISTVSIMLGGSCQNDHVVHLKPTLGISSAGARARPIEKDGPKTKQSIIRRE